ncbi:MAG: hypothetical protein RR630_02625 [Coprobacillus sp.]
MLKHISKLIKVCAYIFFIGYIFREVMSISVSTSYLNTGELMGTQSMFQIIWACFIGFLFSLVIYGFGIIVEYYEMHKMKADDLTNDNIDVK